MRNPHADPGHLWDVIAFLKNHAIDDGEPVTVPELRRAMGEAIRTLESFVLNLEGHSKPTPIKKLSTRKAVRHA